MLKCFKVPADRLAPVADCYSCWPLFTTYHFWHIHETPQVQFSNHITFGPLNKMELSLYLMIIWTFSGIFPTPCR